MHVVVRLTLRLGTFCCILFICYLPFIAHMSDDEDLLDALLLSAAEAEVGVGPSTLPSSTSPPHTTPVVPSASSVAVSSVQVPPPSSRTAHSLWSVPVHLDPSVAALSPVKLEGGALSRPTIANSGSRTGANPPFPPRNLVSGSTIQPSQQPAAQTPIKSNSGFTAINGQSSTSLELAGRLTQSHAVKAEVRTETRSGIRVSRGTVFMDAVDPLFAEYQFVPIRQLPRLLQIGPSHSNHCTVGAVLSKGEPKVSTSKGGGSFAVLKLWSMSGPSGGDGQRPEILTVIVCDTLLTDAYRRIDTGSVLFVAGVDFLKSSAPTASSQPQQPASGAGVAIRVTQPQQLRVLGHAFDLGPCKGVNRATTEPCRVLVNRAESEYCSFHVGDLKKKLYGAASLPPASSTSSSPSSAIVTTAARPPTKTLVTLGAAHSFPHQPLRLAAPSAAAPLGIGRPPERESFIATRGGAVVGRAVTAASHSQVPCGEYAGVVAGAPLPITGASRLAAGLPIPSTSGGNGGSAQSSQRPPSLRALGLTTHGRDVLAAAIRNDDKQRHQAESRSALTTAAASLASTGLPPSSLATATKVEKRPRVEPSSGAALPSKAPRVEPPSSAATVSSSAIAAGRLPSGLLTRTTAAPSAPRSFLDPMPGEVAEGVVFRRVSDPNQKRVLAVDRGGSSFVRMAQNLIATADKGGERTAEGSPSQGGVGALTFAGRVAQGLKSRNDDVRAEDDLRRLDALTDRLSEVDRAMAALEKIHEQPVRAFHCNTCQHYTFSKPADCEAKGHVIVSKMTVRRYFACDHCQSRVGLLGDRAPALLLPRCPQCKRPAMWNKSNAAPAHFTIQSRMTGSDAGGDEKDEGESSAA